MAHQAYPARGAILGQFAWLAALLSIACGCKSDSGNASTSQVGVATAGTTSMLSDAAGAGGARVATDAKGGGGSASGAGGDAGRAGVGEVGTHAGQGGASASAGAGAGAAGAGASADAGGSGDAAPPAAGSGGAPAAGSGGSPMPDPKFLVAASGPCPEFNNGYVMFMPDGKARRVLLYIGDQAKTLDGPLIFSWHSTLPNPEDATSWIGRSVIEEIKAQGGIVAAPATGYPNETRPWDNTPLGAQNTDADQRLMDEIVACAIQKVGIDVRRIHATGMSAGGLKTAQVSLRRSGYLASVVVYSGGLTQGDEPPDQDPENPFAAMILYGGPTDISPVDGIDYTDASRRYLELLKSKGRFAFLCNHGGGHSVPQDSQASAWHFLQDHPFGTQPEPYATALPSGFLRYCSLDTP